MPAKICCSPPRLIVVMLTAAACEGTNTRGLAGSDGNVQDTDVPGTAQRDTADTDPPLVDHTCPPSPVWATGFMDDGLPYFDTASGTAPVEQALVWLECCAPSHLFGGARDGYWQLHVVGTEAGDCVVRVVVGGEGIAHEWTCRLPEPVQVWPELLSDLHVPSVWTYPECVLDAL